MTSLLIEAAPQQLPPLTPWPWSVLSTLTPRVTIEPSNLSGRPTDRRAYATTGGNDQYVDFGLPWRSPVLVL